MTDAEPDPVGEVDAHLGALVPGLRPPAIRRRHAVLVTGPWLAGSSGLVAEPVEAPTTAVMMKPAWAIEL